ncbi:hypothetical protein IHE45_05G214600 [Dioscorea alata]|uniref:Uncharacterized protein n=1 Tax=Dioscorea alata TaxID=55571 RepID=A0ACB7W8Z4_DIOAL|nr:hypothetical protein IHE45_05G214600 [Dioscorea alata]
MDRADTSGFVSGGGFILEFHTYFHFTYTRFMFSSEVIKMSW